MARFRYVRAGSGRACRAAHVPGDRWIDGDGRDLWNAFARLHHDEAFRRHCDFFEGRTPALA